MDIFMNASTEALATIALLLVGFSTVGIASLAYLLTKENREFKKTRSTYIQK